MERNKTMTDYLKLSSKTFYDFHISEINKYKNKNEKILHFVNKDIEFEGRSTPSKGPQKGTNDIS